MSKEELILNASAPNTYRVKMICTNCGNQTTKEIPLGTTITDREPLCPNCGCSTLVKEREGYGL